MRIVEDEGLSDEELDGNNGRISIFCRILGWNRCGGGFIRGDTNEYNKTEGYMHFQYGI